MACFCLQACVRACNLQGHPAVPRRVASCRPRGTCPPSDPHGTPCCVRPAQVPPVGARRQVRSLVCCGAQGRAPGGQGAAAAQPGGPRLQAQVRGVRAEARGRRPRWLGGSGSPDAAMGQVRRSAMPDAPTICAPMHPHLTSARPHPWPPSFNDIVKRLAAAEEGEPTFVSKKASAARAAACGCLCGCFCPAGVSPLCFCSSPTVLAGLQPDEPSPSPPRAHTLPAAVAPPRPSTAGGRCGALCGGPRPDPPQPVPELPRWAPG